MTAPTQTLSTVTLYCHLRIPEEKGWLAQLRFSGLKAMPKQTGSKIVSTQESWEERGRNTQWFSDVIIA